MSISNEIFVFFKGCLVFSCIFTQPRQIWVWWSVKSVTHVNNFSSLYQCFCLCALACAYLPTFLIGLLSAAFLALKEPPLIINIRYQMAFKLFQTNSDTHSRMGETFEDYHIVKPGIWIYFLFNALKFWRYKFCLTMLLQKNQMTWHIQPAFPSYVWLSLHGVAYISSALMNLLKESCLT